jgi:hypothetical protein
LKIQNPIKELAGRICAIINQDGFCLNGCLNMQEVKIKKLQFGNPKFSI